MEMQTNQAYKLEFEPYKSS